jgi:C-terminal domain of alpha-glycerophosphate oxidase
LQEYRVPHRRGHCNIDVAQRLARAYGDQAHHVTEIAQQERLGRRLVPWHDVLEAEVVYAARCATFFCVPVVLSLIQVRGQAAGRLLAACAAVKGLEAEPTRTHTSRAPRTLSAPCIRRLPVSVTDGLAGGVLDALAQLCLRGLLTECLMLRLCMGGREPVQPACQSSPSAPAIMRC